MDSAPALYLIQLSGRPGATMSSTRLTKGSPYGAARVPASADATSQDVY